MPLAIDLFCGLGGWTEGLLAEGWDVVGFDIKRHVYGEHHYPAQLVVQDVLTLHGSQFRDASLIVASPPCQEFSYMAMPWRRGKQIAAALRGDGEFPEGYTGSRTVADLTRLFDACFRIQREACEAVGRKIPMVVENVRGAESWVGRSKRNFGSFYLWGDVPLLIGRYKFFKNPGTEVYIRNNKLCTHRTSRTSRTRLTRVTGAGSASYQAANIAKVPMPLSRSIGRFYARKFARVG
ncbi:MAG: DNA cytosine methyltransferase [Elusimicrobia bacterium]|nr:DNA cytosine methyltransferase [Elusimicrobiota bacterium]